MGFVLLSNDDGVYAPGLRALADAFLASGWRVCVCAPDQERSASGHSISVKRPVVVTSIPWDGLPDDAPLVAYKTDGTPADCVKVALLELCDGKPDIVVSGINNGWNIGTDVFYSGTVGAAMEGAFEGVPGMAVSLNHPTPARLAPAAAMAEQIARRFAANPTRLPSILSLNLPNTAPGDWQGPVEAPLTRIRYTDAYDKLHHARGRDAYWLRGEIIEEGGLPGGDLDCLTRGFATLTVIGWDLSVPGASGPYLQD